MTSLFQSNGIRSVQDLRSPLLLTQWKLDAAQASLADASREMSHRQKALALIDQRREDALHSWRQSQLTYMLDPELHQGRLTHILNLQDSHRTAVAAEREQRAVVTSARQVCADLQQHLDVLNGLHASALAHQRTLTRRRAERSADDEWLLSLHRRRLACKDEN